VNVSPTLCCSVINLSPPQQVEDGAALHFHQQLVHASRDTHTFTAVGDLTRRFVVVPDFAGGILPAADPALADLATCAAGSAPLGSSPPAQPAEDAELEAAIARMDIDVAPAPAATPSTSAPAPPVAGEHKPAATITIAAVPAAGGETKPSTPPPPPREAAAAAVPPAVPEHKVSQLLSSKEEPATM